ncbi:porin [Aureimonas frigidaquae]|uniref:porin n=1 Tax=Aureimonas frigidaquae TaxID=424757 RepID=UPI0007831396|nr:porin [Aureimonas frigidaquae]
MNIKSLLLGSAAALVAVSGARAADAVVMVEPEPVEYVRVCDVYGTGYYYIPGTETCIKTSGYLRFQYNVAGSPVTNSEGDDYQSLSSVRARLNFDVREETELGTLRAFIRLQAQNSGSDGAAAFEMDQGYLQLGGFLAGYRDTLWSSDIGGIEDGLPTDDDLPVGDFNTNQISYTFATGGFAATLGLEDDGTGDIAPDVHGKLAYTGAWGGVFLSAVYDETFNAEDLGPLTDFFPLIPGRDVDGSNDAFALKAGLTLSDLLVADSTLKVDGHWASDPTSYAIISGFTTAGGIIPSNPDLDNPTPGSFPLVLEWSVGAGYSQKFDRVTAGVSGRYGETFDYLFIDPTAPGGVTLSSAQYWAVVGDIGYDLTANMNVLAEVKYQNIDFGGVAEDDQTSGFLRFQRNF